MWKLVTSRKIFIFYSYSLNMDISLIMTLIFLKTCIHVAEVYPEGSVSQNLNIGFSFCLMLCRRLNFEKNDKKYQKFAFFVIKSKPGPKQEI